MTLWVWADRALLAVATVLWKFTPSLRPDDPLPHDVARAWLGFALLQLIVRPWLFGTPASINQDCRKIKIGASVILLGSSVAVKGHWGGATGGQRLARV